MAFLKVFKIQNAATTKLRNNVCRLKPKKLQKSPESEVHAVLLIFKVELNCVSLEIQDHEYLTLVLPSATISQFHLLSTWGHWKSNISAGDLVKQIKDFSLSHAVEKIIPGNLNWTEDSYSLRYRQTWVAYDLSVLKVPFSLFPTHLNLVIIS